MGRITAFTRSDDLHSIQILKELDRRCLPYEEIDLTVYPSKINDLIALVDAPSVPHVFFNTRHVGGLQDCRDELVQNWDRPSSKRYKTALAKYKAEIAASSDPTNLQLPSDTDVAHKDAPAEMRRANVIIDLPDGTQTFVREIIECLKEWVPLDTRVYQGKNYKRSFTGQKLVDALQESLGLDCKQACQFAKSLTKEYGVVRHVDTKNTTFVNTDVDVYRLACHVQPEVLNSYLTWPTDSPRPEDSLALVDNLQRLLNVMEFSSIDPDDGLLNTPHCLKLKKFSKFEEAMCELQNVSISELTMMTQEEMTAFALNLYQVLVRYANLKIGIPVTDSDRQSWLQNVKFILAGETFSLQDWIDILLNKAGSMDMGSSNHSHGSSLHGGSLHSSHGDDSISNSSDIFGVKLDKRIHFCLFLGPYCGNSQWSAPFSRYTPDHLEEQLEMAARAFCQEDRFVRLDKSENKLELLSSVFKSHCRDFCFKPTGLPKAILPYLSGNKRLELMAMIGQTSNKAIQVTYLEPQFGAYTIDGPSYRKSQTATTKIVIKRGSLASKSIKKAMAAKNKRLASVGTVSNSTPSVSESASEYDGSSQSCSR